MSTEASGSSTGAVIEQETLSRELPDIAGVRPSPGSDSCWMNNACSAPFRSVDGCAKVLLVHMLQPVAEGQAGGPHNISEKELEQRKGGAVTAWLVC